VTLYAGIMALVAQFPVLGAWQRRGLDPALGLCVLETRPEDPCCPFPNRLAPCCRIKLPHGRNHPPNRDPVRPSWLIGHVGSFILPSSSVA
jgi:hypothetical protein